MCVCTVDMSRGLVYDFQHVSFNVITHYWILGVSDDSFRLRYLQIQIRLGWASFRAFDSALDVCIG